MIGRLAIVALAVGLASCAGLEPAGRNARSSGPQPTASAPPPQQRQEPQRTAALPPPQATPAPQVSQPPQERAPLIVPPAQQRAAPTATAPAPQPQRTAPPAAAPQVVAPPPATPAPTQQASERATDSGNDDDIVVRGQVERQVPAPAGDPRTNEERRADVRSWDQCVMQVQSAFDSDPMSAQLTTPEEYCSRSLGMADRTGVPIARQNRRR